MSHLAAIVAWAVIIWWIIRTNTRGIRLLEIVVRMMDRVIDNPQTLNIASRGFCRYILSLLLLVQAILLPSRNGNTDNLIITRSGEAGQHNL